MITTTKLKLFSLLLISFFGLKSCVGLPEEVTSNTLSDNIPLWIIFGIGFIIYLIVKILREKKH